MRQALPDAWELNGFVPSAPCGTACASDARDCAAYGVCASPALVVPRAAIRCGKSLRAVSPWCRGRLMREAFRTGCSGCACRARDGELLSRLDKGDPVLSLLALPQTLTCRSVSLCGGVGAAACCDHRRTGGASLLRTGGHAAAGAASERDVGSGCDWPDGAPGCANAVVRMCA